MMHKVCISTLIIILCFLYIYTKQENFEITQSQLPTTTEAQLPISVQLKNELGKLLEISPSRINNLKYEGDITLSTLYVDFDIVENNSLQQNEISKDEANTKLISFINTDTLLVRINNKTVILRKMIPIIDKNLINKAKFFNNEGLKDIAKYANNQYISVPNDESFTKFYTLGFDQNYNIIPKI